MHLRISILRDVPDPRTGNATRHGPLDLLTIAFAASAWGCENCVEFAENREAPFREFLDPSNGAPSHDTFSRLFRSLDPDALSRSFKGFLDHVGAGGSGVLAEDGKTLRRSFDRASGASPLHVVMAFEADARRARPMRHGGGRERDQGDARSSRLPRAARHAGHNRCDPLLARHGCGRAGAGRGRPVLARCRFDSSTSCDPCSNEHRSERNDRLSMKNSAKADSPMSALL